MTSTTLLQAGLLTLLLLGPVAAQDSQPASTSKTLGEVLKAAREAKVLVEGTRREYFKGKNPGVALVDHETTVTKEGLSSAFTEHAPSGAFVRSTYRIDAEGILQEVKIERGTRDSYPDATETVSYRREKGELVEVKEGPVKEGEQAERSKLPQNAIPMSTVTFLLPTLAKHLPAKLEFTPLFEAQVHTSTMVLTWGESQAAIVVDGQPVITIDVDGKGAIKQLNAPGDNVIKQLTAEEAEAALAKLRPA